MSGVCTASDAGAVKLGRTRIYVCPAEARAAAEAVAAEHARVAAKKAQRAFVHEERKRKARGMKEAERMERMHAKKWTQSGTDVAAGSQGTEFTSDWLIDQEIVVSARVHNPRNIEIGVEAQSGQRYTIDLADCCHRTTTGGRSCIPDADRTKNGGLVTLSWKPSGDLSFAIAAELVRSRCMRRVANSERRPTHALSRRANPPPLLR